MSRCTSAGKGTRGVELDEEAVFTRDSITDEHPPVGTGDFPLVHICTISGSSYLVSALIVHIWTSGKSPVPTKINSLTVMRC